MAYDIYGMVKDGLKRLAVPAGTGLPQSANSADWRKLGTMDHIWPSLEQEVKTKGHGSYEVKITITEPE